MPGTKTCTRCGCDKPVSEFGNDRKRKDGLFPWCRSCKKRGDAESALKHREKRLQSKREYNQRNHDRYIEGMRQWYAAHRDEQIEQRRQRRLANLESERAKSREWAAANPERKKEARQRWHAENLERHRGNCRRRYYRFKQPYLDAAVMRHRRVRQATPAWVDRQAVLEIYRECRRLTRETGVRHHVDHIIPLRGRRVSGLHVAENLRIVHAFENLSKGNRIEDNYPLQA